MARACLEADRTASTSGGGGGVAPGQLVKLVVALALLGVAGVLIAWTGGAFDRPARVDAAQAAEREAEYQEQQEELAPLLTRPDAVQGDA